ncbi:hypothetical protein LXL04_006212 [Taraxacum kok-saghyz]
MPFGLKNAGATYQRLVNKMFKDKLGDTMEVYIDDMVVKSKKVEDHLRDLEDAFRILDEYNMKLNPAKCHFGVKAGKFLGYMVTKRGIEASPEQIKAVINLKAPTSVKDIQRLTGRIAALNRFISRSSDSTPPLLVKPIDAEPLILYLAVSSHTVSAVLVKDLEGDQHPVYYVSKSLLDPETRYSHLEKLILALVMASTKLRHYFETHPIHVKTNYPIKSVMRKPEMSGRMAKWSVKLSTYNIIYEPKTAIKSQALADFVADFSNDLKKEVEIEVEQLHKENVGKWTLFTDGASNAKGTGLGIMLKSPEGDIIPQAVSCEFNATNNEAEYEALIMGLQLAQDLNIKDIQVYVDSLLITNHYNGSYAVKGEKLVLYLEVLKQIAATFDFFELSQVPREENTEADALANLGSSLRIPPDTVIPIVHLMIPAIEDPTRQSELTCQDPENQVSAVVDPSTSNPNMQDPTDTQGSWTKPIKEYILNGTIPQEEKNERAFRIKTSRFTIIRGKLPIAPGGKVFMLVMTDYLTKWIEAEAFAQVKEKEVVSFIKRNILTRFGILSEIICDNGSQFISKRTTDFCSAWGIKMITSTPVHPQANGQAESSNKIIVNNLKKRLDKKKGRWAEELPFVLWADRTTAKTATCQTPYALVFGNKAVIPMEVVIPTARYLLQGSSSQQQDPSRRS